VSKFYHRRIIAEVEVDVVGEVTRFGKRRFAPLGTVVKDIVVLRPGVDAADVARFTKVSDVTSLVVDFKTGLLGKL
jgi:hypothetical protein